MKQLTDLGITVTGSETKAQLEALFPNNGLASSEAKPTKPRLTEPVEGQACYYVWDDKGNSVKSFHEEQYKGEAFKFAKELADQHEGWTIS